MLSAGNAKGASEIEEESESAKNEMPLRNASQRGLLHEKKRKNTFLDTMRHFPGFNKFESPRTDLDKPFVKKINWASLWKLGKDWIRDPFNMALFVWIACVAVSGAFLFLVMTGMLNAAMPRKSERDAWFKVNNQILNALFTLMCLYQHPKRFYQLVLLRRWRPQDVLILRNAYCKNGTEKPNERKHMVVVVALLHVNCFAQYALCGLNLGYPRSRRPAVGVGISISIAMSAPAIASLYNIVSPLGREYEAEIDHESQNHYIQPSTPEKRYSFMPRDDCRVPVSSPDWQRGLFDFWDDVSLGYMSLFCSCCVFGWNASRLGFGNMYVHIMTFLLFCSAPFFIFNLAAINIDNEAVREALGISGILLCVLGLLYGGFWRIQMRKRFNLPGNTLCCGKPAVTDCFQWLCCCACSLAQEVRTADYYEVVDEKLYVKPMGGDIQPVLSPLPREDGSTFFGASPEYPYWTDGNSAMSSVQNSPFQGRGVGFASTSETTKPPARYVIRRDDLSH